MLELFQGLILGLVQGVTEFFPVSSSGHLILIPALFGWKDQGLAFDTILHLGTLVALVWAFRVDLTQMYQQAVVKRDRGARRFVWMVLVASMPGLIAGALFGERISSVFRGPLPVAFDLIFWALVLLFVDRWSAKRTTATRDARKVSWRQTIIVGLSQVMALFPGTSRSGITMTGGMLSGLDRAAAVAFSFYVSIPTIAAAGAYGMIKLIREPSVIGSGGFGPLIIGFIAAAVSGAWAVRFLRAYVAKHSLSVFVWYRIALAAVVLWFAK
jgi:undecaprenyl-diphosphatase